MSINTYAADLLNKELTDIQLQIADLRAKEDSIKKMLSVDLQDTLGRIWERDAAGVDASAGQSAETVGFNKGN